MIILQIRIKSQETGKTHQEHQMEIGKAVSTLIQPNDGMLQISK